VGGQALVLSAVVADTASPQASALGWPLLATALVWLGLAVSFRKNPRRRFVRRVSLRLTILAALTLYFATLGPHLGHHITEASAAESHCTVLLVIDSTYTGLSKGQPIPVPAPDPLFALPVPEVPSHLAVFYFSSTYPRAPPGTLLVPTRL
jgi:hypothetical protein